MAKIENFIHIDPNKQEAKVPHLNGQTSLNYNKSSHLEKKHQEEKEKTFIKYEKEKHKVILETKEHLNKEQLIHQAKTDIYKKIGIDANLNKNSPVENFKKGIIDTLIIGNYDLAIEIYNTNGKVLIDALQQLASLEGLKQIAEALGENIIGLFTGNAYEKGKSFAELGLTGIGVTAGLKIAKFGIKKLKHIDVPKHNFDKLSVSYIAKMSDSDRLEVARFFMKNHFKKELNKNQEDAIIRAHKVGEHREGAGIYNYKFSEKAEKLKILEQAGFTKEERKLLLEKGVCGKLPEARDLSKVDTLEMKGTYALDEIKGLNIVEASKRIETFGSSIDIKYLINHPERINEMLNIVESICNYINKNSDLIMRLDKQRLADFKFGFNEMRKTLDRIQMEPNLMIKSRKNILDVYENNIITTFYKLNPNLAPKN